MQTGDGRSLLVRPIRPEDEELLREAFKQLSDDTILNRFFYSRKPLSRKSALAAASPDFEREPALVVVDDNEPDQQIVAGGRYVLDPKSNVAELAIMVRDDWQGNGIDGFLFERLVAIGRDRGVSDFAAFVRHEDKPMIELIRGNAPGAVESHLHEDMVELRFSTERESPSKD
jgi:acetyltransferase